MNYSFAWRGGPSRDRWSSIWCSSLSICSCRWISNVAPIGPSAGGDEDNNRPKVMSVIRASQSGMASQSWTFNTFHLYNSPAACSSKSICLSRLERHESDQEENEIHLQCCKMPRQPSGKRCCTLADLLNMSVFFLWWVSQGYVYESFSGYRTGTVQRVERSIHIFIFGWEKNNG